MNKREWPRRFAVAAVTVLFIAPLFFMVAGALRRPGLAPPDGFEWLPPIRTWSNYSFAIDIVPLGEYALNSLMVVIVGVPVTVLIASWAGFAIATAEPAVRRRLIVVSVLALMVPVSALWVARAALYEFAGIIDTPLALVAPALMATTPLYVLIFALAYGRVPRRIYEAAELDGLSPLQIWRRVAWPLAKPAAFAVAALAFAWHWSNFMDALLYISTKERSTLPLGLRDLYSLEPTNHPILLAGAVLVTMPAVLAFLSAQRAFFTRTLDV